MAIRYCGEAKIRLWLTEARTPGGAWETMYRASVNDGRGGRATVLVGVPAHITRAIDSSEAFDSAAHAAVSFALDEHPGRFDQGVLDVVANGAGWAIRRSPGGKVVPS